MLEIKLSKQAGRFLNDIPIKEANKILDLIEKLAIDDGSVSTKQLSGYKSYKRAKMPPFRIIFRIDNNELNIEFIGHRKDVYEKFNRTLS